MGPVANACKDEAERIASCGSAADFLLVGYARLVALFDEFASVAGTELAACEFLGELATATGRPVAITWAPQAVGGPSYWFVLPRAWTPPRFKDWIAPNAARLRSEGVRVTLVGKDLRVN